MILLLLLFLSCIEAAPGSSPKAPRVNFQNMSAISGESVRMSLVSSFNRPQPEDAGHLEEESSETENIYHKSRHLKFNARTYRSILSKSPESLRNILPKEDAPPSDTVKTCGDFGVFSPSVERSPFLELIMNTADILYLLMHFLTLQDLSRLSRASHNAFNSVFNAIEKVHSDLPVVYLQSPSLSLSGAMACTFMPLREVLHLVYPNLSPVLGSIPVKELALLVYIAAVFQKVKYGVLANYPLHQLMSAIFVNFQRKRGEYVVSNWELVSIAVENGYLYALEALIRSGIWTSPTKHQNVSRDKRHKARSCDILVLKLSLEDEEGLKCLHALCQSDLVALIEVGTWKLCLQRRMNVGLKIYERLLSMLASAPNCSYPVLIDAFGFLIHKSPLFMLPDDICARTHLLNLADSSPVAVAEVLSNSLLRRL